MMPTSPTNPLSNFLLSAVEEAQTNKNSDLELGKAHYLNIVGLFGLRVSWMEAFLFSKVAKKYAHWVFLYDTVELGRGFVIFKTPNNSSIVCAIVSFDYYLG